MDTIFGRPRSRQRVVVKFEHLAIATPGEITSGRQYEMVALAIHAGQIAYEALGAATPAVQDVQDDGLGIEAGIKIHFFRRTRRRGGDALAQLAERRSGQRIGTRLWHRRSNQSPRGIGDEQMVQQYAATRCELRGQVARVDLLQIQAAQCSAVPHTEQWRERWPIQRCMFAPGVAQCVDCAWIGFGTRTGWQWRARRIDIVQRRSNEHVGQTQRTDRARVPPGRQQRAGA